jgi:hypothetical protein
MFIYKFQRTKLAERVGFEPTERFPAHSISSAANSTTLAPLQGLRIAECRLTIADWRCTENRRHQHKSI